MQCKSLWIKASAKCINVNVNVLGYSDSNGFAHIVDFLELHEFHIQYIYAQPYTQHPSNHP